MPSAVLSDRLKALLDSPPAGGARPFGTHNPRRAASRTPGDQRPRRAGA